MNRFLALIFFVFFSSASWAMGPCTASFLAPRSHWGPNVGLNDVDLQTAIANSELSAEQMSLISKHSAGVIDIYELIHRDHIDGFLLGLADNAGIYGAIEWTMGLRGWGAGYRKFRIPKDLVEHTALYMERLTKGKTKSVFLVPSRIWSYEVQPHGGFTRKEMEWLLAHPERMKNVLFVFGAAEIIDQESWTKAYMQMGTTNRRRPFDHISAEDNWSIIMARALRTHAEKYRPEESVIQSEAKDL